MLTEIFASAPLDEWRKRLEDFIGQWAVVQDTLEAAVDPQTIANGYLQDSRPPTAPRSSSSPRPCSSTRPAGGRAPTSTSTATDPRELGIDWDTIIDLKLRGVVA